MRSATKGIGGTPRSVKWPIRDLLRPEQASRRLEIRYWIRYEGNDRISYALLFSYRGEGFDVWTPTHVDCHEVSHYP